MAVRNFYVRGRIDGRKTLLEGGPVAKLGGMNMDFLIRDEGSIVKAAAMQGFAVEGSHGIVLLRYQLVDHRGEVLWQVESTR